MQLNTFFKRLGYDIEPREIMMPYIDKWKSWYKGDVASFHHYYIYNGNKNVPMHRKTLKMAKKISEDYSGHLMNEKVSFNFKDEKTRKCIDQILNDNCFYVLANESIEKSFSMGTGAFVLSLTDLIVDSNTKYIDSKESKLKIEFATADKIIPLSYANGKITECAFAVQKKIGNKNVLVVSIHLLREDRYIIKNYLLKINRGGNLTDISNEMDDSLREFDTQSHLPWFFIIKPNIINNIQDGSPFGISVFANAIDELEGTDITYDSFINEFVLGKKRIFIEEDLTKVDESTGQLKFTFDTNDVVFHQLPTGEMGEGKNRQPIMESNMTLRIAEHKEGIQLNLNLLSSKCGMGDSYYTFDGKGVKTATEVISENSDLYRTIKKHEIVLEDTLVDMFKSIIYICKNFLNLDVNEDDEITIDFDDSIIEDKAEKKRQALLEKNAGLIDDVEYFMITRNYTEEQAQEFVDKIRNRSPIEEEPPIEE